jgi:hypothetical protein
MEVPDRISTQEIVGWRGWDVSRRRTGVRLVSGNRFFWHPDRWTEAACARSEYDRDHIAPMSNCTCGLYAARTLDILFAEWSSHAVPRQSPVSGSRGETAVVYGQVAFSGKVVAHQRVYRGQKGRVVRLWVPDIAWRVVEPLRQTYNIPVELGNPFKFIH